MPEGIKLTILTEEEMSGTTRLRALYSSQMLKAEFTDLAILTCAKFQYSSYLDYIYECGTYSYTKSPSILNTNVVCYNNHNKDTTYGDIAKKWYCIRPVLELSPELFNIIIRNKRHDEGLNVDLVEFGSYLQNIPDKTITKKLKRLKSRNKLQKVDGSFTFNVENIDIPGHRFRRHDIYELDGQKYACVQANFAIPADEERSKKLIKLSNGRHYYDGEEVWVKVEPVTWVIDYDTMKLISTKDLVGGIQLLIDTEKYECEFEETEVDKYMQKYMFHDLFQFEPLLKKEEVVEDNTNDKEIELLLGQISQYGRYYLGEEDIQTKVEKLINDYNARIDDLAKNQGVIDTTLKVSYRDEKALFRDLRIDLNKILADLKKESDKSKVYFDMIDILCGYNEEDELSKLIKDARRIILESKIFEKEKESLTNELDQIIDNSIERIHSYIEEVRVNKKNTPNKTIDELKSEFRRDFQSFLEKLHNIAVSKDLIREIKECTLAIINNQYVETKNDRAKYIINIISEVVGTIHEVGDEKDLDKLRGIMEFEIDYSLDTLTVLKRLNDIYKRVYMLELDILERKEIMQKLNNSKIKVDTKSVFSRSYKPLRRVSEE